MKTRKTVRVIILTIVIIVSAYFTIVTGQNIQLDNKLLYIPIVVFIISLALLISGIINSRYTIKTKSLENRLEMWNSITYKVKKAGETAFNKLPIGIVVIDKDSKIVWANPNARTIFMSPLEHIYLKDIASNLYNKLMNARKELNEITEGQKITYKENIYGKIYYVEYLVKFDVIYFTDITKYENLQTKYYNRTEVLGYINIDNLEETLQEFDVQTRAEYEGKIVGALAKWATENGAFIRGLTSTRYILVTDQQQLEKLIQSNFSILDDIKQIFNTSRLARITLSMGIACDDVNVNDLSEEAQQQLELALNRGGDQVVVKKNNETLFFGAKTDPILKESKVEIRVKSEELENLMLTSSNIFIIGHKNIDADGFAATVAMYKWATSLGKEAHIIYDENSIDSTVARVMDSIKREYVAFLDAFTTLKEIPHLINKDSLLIVVDFQIIYQCIDQKLFNRFEKIAIIDHHRRGEGAISSPKFYYSQAAASSTVELIFELISFAKEPVEFSELEATWMLLGIVVDTNNFIYRTSSATFEAASTLKKYGADMNAVKAYLKEDVSEKLTRQDIIRNMERYKDVVAITYADDDLILERASLAKVSDELISISGIELAVTIGRISEKQVGLSARSLGKVNCQVIMEKMGGGGHLNNAAAQRNNETVHETLAILKEKIDDYLLEEENMKIILIKDLKGKGKKGDIIEVAAGYGNNLVRNNTAILASPENMQKLEEEKNQAMLREAELVQQMKELKEKIESTEVKISVKVGKEGKLFGSVSTKQITDAIQAKLGEKIDKRKIALDGPINSLGTYEIPIQLHKDVIAKIKLFIVEE